MPSRSVPAEPLTVDKAKFFPIFVAMTTSDEAIPAELAAATRPAGRAPLAMKQLELLVERIILASRWLLVVFYLGLAAALAVYAVSFAAKFVKIAVSVLALDEAEMILAMLSLIDAALVASLVVMVMISSYENFVSRFDQTTQDLTWLGKMDSGSLKIKVASAIVAISSIHLLQVFMNAQQYENSKIMWLTLMHLAFIASAVFLGLLDRISGAPKKI
jgi:uncharacterized protein (TIGR00645 family)